MAGTKPPRKPYRRRPACPPTLVGLHRVPDYEIIQLQAITAFRLGYADTAHFDVLVDCRDMLTLSAAKHNDKAIRQLCDEVFYTAMIGIKERYARTKKFGATGEELKALELMVETSADFWKRKSGNEFGRAIDAMKREHDRQFPKKEPEEVAA